ncbi:MAG: hypothetical protein AAF850_10695 [Pseudomonadota bacterium]
MPGTDESKSPVFRPGDAHAGLERWRKALAKATGVDPGAQLDETRNFIAQLKIFGAAPHLARQFMRFPRAAAMAFEASPQAVIEEANADLIGLGENTGAPDLLRQALFGVRERIEIALAVAELTGAMRARETASLRARSAARLAEVSVSLLIRSAAARGETTLAPDGENGVFILAGGAFGASELAPLDPLSLFILYDDAGAGSSRGVTARSFARLGAEFAQAFDAAPAHGPVAHFTTPFSTSSDGAGLMEAASVARSMAAGDERARHFFRTARVVGGDMGAGAAFLESVDDAVWSQDQDTDKQVDREFEATDPRTLFANVGERLRTLFGAARPALRAGSFSTLLRCAIEDGVISEDAGARLNAGADFALGLAGWAQRATSVASPSFTDHALMKACAVLVDVASVKGLTAMKDGAQVQAEETLAALETGPSSVFRSDPDAWRHVGEVGPPTTLSDLGFNEGLRVSSLADGWVQAARVRGAVRFSQLAPGLLTELARTQAPDTAADLFDKAMVHGDTRPDLLSAVASEGPIRDAVVDTFGCFPATSGVLSEHAQGVRVLIDYASRTEELSAADWLRTAPPPPPEAGPRAVCQWRAQAVAEITVAAAGRRMTFGQAGEAFRILNDATLLTAFAYAGGDKADGLAMHVFDTAGYGAPGGRIALGFIADEPIDLYEDIARKTLSAIHEMSANAHTIAPDVTRRPGGLSGPIVSSFASYKDYAVTEASALDRALHARGRVIAGSATSRKKAAAALKAATSGGAKLTALFRDLDRARAQQARRNPPSSNWDVYRLPGGLADAEMVISALIMKNAISWGAASEGGISQALTVVDRSGQIDGEIIRYLSSAFDTFQRLSLIQSLSGWRGAHLEPARPRFAAMLASAAGVQDAEQIPPLLIGHAAFVKRLYAQFVLGRPATDDAAAA